MKGYLFSLTAAALLSALVLALVPEGSVRRTVQLGCGLLLALRVDEARLGEQDVGPLLVALSPTPVSDGGGYRALVGPLDGKDGA